MKTKRIIVTIIIIVTLSALLCSCAESSIDVNTPQTNHVESNEIGEGKVEGESQDVCCEPVPLNFMIDDGNNSKDMFIGKIGISKSQNKKDDDYSVYSTNKIMDIKEFYSLDDLKIDGYELFRVWVGVAGYIYQYVPIEKLDGYREGGYVTDTIDIVIERPEYMTAWDDTPFEGAIKQAKENGWDYIFEDGMFYNRGSIDAIMGNTIISIRVPKELDTYEYLRKLALQVIEKAELVTVD